jgi:hypothetical protein
VTPDNPVGLQRIGILVESHPEAFVGQYRRSDG